MKKQLLITVIFILFVSTLFAQTQIGQDIDGETSSEQSGSCVSISADGTTVAISALYNLNNGSASGQVRIYKYLNGTWTQQGSDLNGNLGDQFGNSVSLSSDGNIIAIGAPALAGFGQQIGYVKVFNYNNSNWVQLGNTLLEEAQNDGFGTNVKLSEDGTRVAVSSPYNDANGNNSGSVRVFNFSNTNWVQIGSDIDGVGTNQLESFGKTTSFSGDGNTIVASGNSNNCSNCGYVKIYSFQNNNWIQKGTTLTGQNVNENSGKSISISADGNIVAISSPGYSENGIIKGRVRVFNFNNSNNSWIELGSGIIGSNTNSSVTENFGGCISISANGSIIGISSPTKNNSTVTQAGMTQIFNFNNSIWNQIGANIFGEGASDRSGESISISSDGSRIAIGAKYNNGLNFSSFDTGSVRVYDLSTLSLSNLFNSDTIEIYPNPTSKILNFNFKNNIIIEKIIVFDITGKKILEQTHNNSQINVENLANGLYTIEAFSDGEKFQTRFIKN